jgi:ectoine hydroxylase-related dioxygenase (phytanoyl-CoA dioxygenase family)
VSYSLEADGFCLIEGLLSDVEIIGLTSYLEAAAPIERGRGGVRNLLDLAGMRDLACAPSIRRVVEAVLGASARVVRGILFDKTEGANWKVPWHQDVTIAVTTRVEAEGYGPWSAKEGVLHVQPPATVLERMISIRLHLDECPAENGALRVLRGSHAAGKLNERAIQERAEKGQFVTCAMRSGGALLMRPLLIHSSSTASVPGHRRVIHFDYAAVALPAGMGWAADQA